MKNKTNKQYLEWDNYTFYSKIDLFNNKLLKTAIDNFWKCRIIKIPSGNHIALLVRIKSPSGIIKTLTKLEKMGTDNESKLNLQRILIDRLSIKQSGYYDLSVNEVIFSFGVIEGLFDGVLPTTIHRSTPHLNYSHYKLPIVSPNDDMSKFGNIFRLVNENDGTKTIYIQTENNNNIFEIKVKEDGDIITNQVSLLRSGAPSLQFTDIANKNEDTFTRKISSRVYTYSNEGEQLFMTQDKQILKHIEAKNKEVTRGINFITADIETIRGDSGELTPFLFSLYDGLGYSSFYLSDFNSVDEMVYSFIDSLIDLAISRQKVSRNLSVYFHNLANFDSYFILKYLFKKGEQDNLKITKHDDRLISIRYRVNISKSKHLNVIFLDSFQLLPASLRDLSKTFNSNDGQKGEFDFNKATISNLETVRIEATLYCNQDCFSLYSVLDKFSQMVFNQ